MLAATKSFEPHLTGRQNLKFFAALFGISSRKTKQRIEELANRLEVHTMLDAPLSYYSAGVRHRFALIRSLLHDPQILLLDEPTCNLDPEARKMIYGFICSYIHADKKRSVIFTTHHKDDVRLLANRCIILDKGKIIQQGSGFLCETYFSNKQDLKET